MQSLDLLGKHVGENLSPSSSRGGNSSGAGASLFQEQLSQQVSIFTSQSKRLDTHNDPKETFGNQSQPPKDPSPSKRASNVVTEHTAKKEPFEGGRRDAHRVSPDSKTQETITEAAPPLRPQPNNETASKSPSAAEEVDKNDASSNVEDSVQGSDQGLNSDSSHGSPNNRIDEDGRVAGPEYGVPNDVSVEQADDAILPVFSQLNMAHVGELQQGRSDVKQSSVNDTRALEYSRFLAAGTDVQAQPVKAPLLATPFIKPEVGFDLGPVPTAQLVPSKILESSVNGQGLLPAQSQQGLLAGTNNNTVLASTAPTVALDSASMVQTSLAFQRALQSSQQKMMSGAVTGAMLGGVNSAVSNTTGLFSLSDTGAHTAELLNGQNPTASPLERLSVSQTQNARFGVNVQFGRADWNANVAASVAKMAAQNLNYAEIQLDPPELGPLQVRVQMNNDQASVTFMTQSAQVREALEQSNQKLKELFDGEGLDLVDVDVRDQEQQHNDDELDSEQAGEQRYASEADTEDVSGTGVEAGLSSVINVGVDDFV